MHFFALTFLLGDLYVQTLPALFSNITLIIILLISFVISAGLRSYSRYYYLPLIFAAGLVWSTWYANSLLAWSLPKALEGKSIWITGHIASLPIKNKFGSRFEFMIDHLNHAYKKGKVRLIWQNDKLRVGEEYELLVRLKRIHAPQNPAAFDFEAWSLQKGIRAAGYVVANKKNKLLNYKWYKYPIQQLRQILKEKISENLPHSQTAPWLMALMIGERNGISQTDWQILRNTGTNHLMAIGGLHIGILAGFVYYLVMWCFRRIPWLVLRIPAKEAGMCAALFAAMLYSTLAGFSIPTQRASFMFIICILALLSRRRMNVWHAWSIAICIVLLCNPLNVLTESFWLSFGTIALIIYGMNGRLQTKGFWWKWGRVQWVVGLGLIPITLALFQECSLISFFANSIAIPWMEFFILPFCFLSIILLFPFPSLAQLLLQIADTSLTFLWSMLTWFAHFNFFTWQFAMPNQLILILSILGIVLLLAPKGFPGKWLGLIWFMPLLCCKPVKPNLGDIWVSVLDVGQGLAVIVQTKNHVLVYDTGPKYSEQFNAGENIIVPYLRALRISEINMLVISHGDMDHSGGMKSLVNVFPALKTVSSVPDQLPLKGNITTCLAGQTWQWDQVEFSFLYPTENNLYQGNNSSCVLRITNHEQSILLTGDIEKKAEEDLLRRIPDKLPATILIAPHHGSKTSGLSHFISKIHPQFVIYSTGYRNRYHFPHSSITLAYTNINAEQFNTANTGTIKLLMKKNNKNIAVDLYRLSHKHYWLES